VERKELGPSRATPIFAQSRFQSDPVLAFMRCGNLFSGTLHSGKPQLKQTRSFGNTRTGGFSRFFMPGIWMLISTPNLVCLSDPHDLHAITAPAANLTALWEWAHRRYAVSNQA
jgi:hypothetical protein